MRRPAPDLPVTPTMLRHFAILTVAITGCIAMFADGESRKDFEQKLAEQQTRSLALKAEKQKAAARSSMAGGLVIAKGTRLQSSGDDIDSGGGSGSGGSGGSGGGSGPSELGGIRAPFPSRPMLAASPPPIAGVPNPVEGYLPMIAGVDGLATDLGSDGRPKKGKFVDRTQLRPPPPANDGGGSQTRTGGAMANSDGIVE